MKKHRETGSVKESKHSTLIIECKGLLLKRLVCVAFSYDHNLQLKVVNGTLNSIKYRDEIPESDARPSLNSPEGRKMVLPWPSLSPDLNPI